MYLKRYQERVVRELSHFFETCAQKKEDVATILATLPPGHRGKLPVNWVEMVFGELELVYEDRPQNGLGEYYPRSVVKVPTGGGKTLLAVEAIKEYQKLFAKKRHGLVVWIVPSETIYSQTIRQLKDKSHHLRQLIDQSSGGNTIILEKGQKLTQEDIAQNLVILFVMIQSVSRATNKEALKVFQDSGGYEGFFPPDNRYDLHQKIIEQFPNVDFYEYIGRRSVKTSLGNAIRVSNPLIIIDEIHKVFTPVAKETIDSLNPAMIVGFSATPKKEMNIISKVSGLELKEEEMIKLDMHIIPPVGKENDWQGMLQRIKAHREALEKKAIAYERQSGKYIRPMVLIQAEATGKDQRGKGNVHAEDVKEHLMGLGVSAEQIAIKSSAQNDIEDMNLLSKDVEIRYIITKEALKEGWDNPFAYILGIIPNAKSASSMTQLVGRILRQPYVQKTGIPELDESYIYFCKGEVSDVLNRVEKGLKDEGLEDILGNIAAGGEDPAAPKPRKRVRIKEAFRDKEEQFYLPVWLMQENGTGYRRFSYARDIAERLDFASLELDDDFIRKLSDSMSQENKDVDTYLITIAEDSKVITQKDVETRLRFESQISLSYTARRLSEVIDNPFLASTKAKEWFDILTERLGKEKVGEHFGYIVAQLVQWLEEHKQMQEKELFEKQIKAGTLCLAIIDDEQMGMRIPDSDTIEASRIPNPYDHYLFEDLDFSSLNSLEQKVGAIIDKQSKVLWWVRNKAKPGWYAIQGWKKHKIRPDFIAAKKKDSEALEIVYILESKGEQLLGNRDTKYKKTVLDMMTQLYREGKIIIIKRKLFGLNQDVEAHLIEQNKEKMQIKHLFK